MVWSFNSLPPNATIQCRPKSVHEGEGEKKMREFKEKILSEEQAGRGENAKTKVNINLLE